MRGKDLLECMEYIDDALIEEALNPTVASYKNRSAAKWAMAVACMMAVGISATVFWSHQNVNVNLKQDSNDIVAQTDIVDNYRNQSDAGRTAETGFAMGIEEDASNSITSVTENNTSEGAKAKSMDDQTAVKSNMESLEIQKETKLADLEMQEDTKTAYKVIHDYYEEKDTSEYCYSAPEKGTVLCYHYLQETINYYATQESTTDTADDMIYAYQVAIDIYGDIETIDGIQYEDLYHSDAGNLLIEQEYRRLIDLGYAVRLSEDFQLTGVFTKTEIDTFSAAPEYGYVFRFENES